MNPTTPQGATPINMKLTDQFPWGVLDTETKKIVARSSEGYLAADKARAMNRKAGSGKLEPSKDFDSYGNRIWRKNLSDKYTITQSREDQLS